MKILHLFNRVPFQMTDGGSIAMVNLAESLTLQGAEVKMLTLNTVKHGVEIKNLSAELRNKFSLEAVDIDTSVKPVDAFLNLFSKESYNVVRFYSKEFEQKLKDVLQAADYDVVLLETLFMMPYLSCIRQNSKAKIILRSQNVEYIIWERLAANERNPLKRIYLKFLARRLKKYELEGMNRVEAILPITPDDGRTYKALGCHVPMLSVPAGVNMDDYPDQLDESAGISLFHLGSMDWLPNLEGVDWFLKECWPLIHGKFPSVKLFLAGRGFPKVLMQNAPENVICDGEVPDAKNYMNGKQVMIVPLRSGGGMRIKIIQGMALGKTIISTNIGAEGINCTNGKDILIANSPAEFLQEVEKCITDSLLCFSVGRAARELIAEHYSNQAIGKSVLDFFKLR